MSMGLVLFFFVPPTLCEEYVEDTEVAHLLKVHLTCIARLRATNLGCICPTSVLILSTPRRCWFVNFLLELQVNVMLSTLEDISSPKPEEIKK